MRAWSRSLTAVAAGLALAGAAGCGANGSSGDTPPPPPKDELASLDPCSILTPQEISSLGLDPNATPDQDVKTAPGCTYNGDALTVTTHRNLTETAESSASKPVWTKFDRTDVNGRPGATAITQGTELARACTTMFDAGKGMVDVIVSTNNPSDQSQCDQSQKIAKQVEPRMPKKQ